MDKLIINCDWGTTQFRLRAVESEQFAVAAEFRSAEGVARLAATSADDRPSRYRSVLVAGLRQLIARPQIQLDGAPVLVSGMASSSIGWQDVPYAHLPLALDGSGLSWQELPAIESAMGRHRVLLISGACTDSDVMRGEEIELIGLFALAAAAELGKGSLVIKPGTHSKHLRIENQSIVGMQTFMTGELFDVLGRHSLLRHSLDDPAAADSDFADAQNDFRAGVRHGRAAPLAATLFQVRTRQLLGSLSGTRNRAFLSGVLLGNELAGLGDARLGGLPLVLCATEPLQTHYLTALEELGLDGRLTVIPPAEVELLSARGQAVLWRRLGDGANEK